jgi:23S rRNA (cytosine1962-C5)-methyltransferase
MTLSISTTVAVASITRRAADRIRAGHLWIYRSDIESSQADLPPGSLVTVTDSRRIPLGTALYSADSEIALRLVSRQPGLNRADYLVNLRERLAAALNLRTRVAAEAFSLSGEDNACRLFFSEADDIPGIVADRYNGLVVVQLLTQGTAQDDVRRALVDVLSAQPWVETIVERPDARVRELEHLPAVPEMPLFVRAGCDGVLKTIFAINGVRFHFDAGAGQKTGAFLDQRLNYWMAMAHARGRALDVCTYQGGFALHLARHCSRVTGVDTSRAALDVADRNLELNAGPNGLHKLTAKVDWIEADAFELLRDFADAGELYDTIVLDPPAFAKSKRAAEGAMRGYKELNLRALKMLRHGANGGGTLITCSCSHHVGLEDFLEVVRSAAIDAGRSVQLLETRGAAPDHPAILTLPETTYLKCLILPVR